MADGGVSGALKKRTLPSLDCTLQPGHDVTFTMYLNTARVSKTHARREQRVLGAREAFEDVGYGRAVLGVETVGLAALPLVLVVAAQVDHAHVQVLTVEIPSRTDATRNLHARTTGNGRLDEYNTSGEAWERSGPGTCTTSCRCKSSGSGRGCSQSASSQSPATHCAVKSDG